RFPEPRKGQKYRYGRVIAQWGVWRPNLTAFRAHCVPRPTAFRLPALRLLSATMRPERFDRGRGTSSEPLPSRGDIVVRLHGQLRILSGMVR
ncbi:hypothetical protein, partial [Alicyclobacillus acidiphilus]